MKDFSEIEQLENGTSTDKIITLRSVYKDGKQTVQPAFDRNTGFYAGVDRIPEREKENLAYYVVVGKTGKDSKENTRIKLYDGITFNLENEVDKVNWKWVRELPCVAMSFDAAQRENKATFYVHIATREAEIKLKKSQLILKAMELVKNDSPGKYVDRALLLGADMENDPQVVILDYLYEQARLHPDRVIRLYEDKTMLIYLLFRKALKSRIIFKDNSAGFYRFDNIALGNTEDSSIAYLLQKENQDVVELINRTLNPELYAGAALSAKEAKLEQAAATHGVEPVTPTVPTSPLAAATKKVDISKAV